MATLSLYWWKKTSHVRISEISHVWVERLTHHRSFGIPHGHGRSSPWCLYCFRFRINTSNGACSYESLPCHLVLTLDIYLYCPVIRNHIFQFRFVNCKYEFTARYWSVWSIVLSTISQHPCLNDLTCKIVML